MSETILITGVGKRLGFALAQQLLADGYNVVGTYRSDYPQLQLLRDNGADLQQVDFYQQSSLEEFLHYVGQEYKTLRAVIHNASDWKPENKTTPSDNASQIMHQMMTIHATVPYLFNLTLKDQLMSGDKTSDIIHISDYVAEKGSKKHIAYAASKAALNNLTLSFSAMLAPKVKVNTLSPAMIKFNEHDDEAYKTKALKKALIPTEAGFEEIIDGIKFVLASHYMTGRTLHLDGGRHLK
ncbi:MULTISPECIES: dihydromonapterin reductase [unclassified Vibrio]|uniref:dihydromonapterin reductase n=1 Tax=unclassified Vibrio TaxID=2614977 RepID=UPI000C82BF84|nr:MULTISPECIES: dihydromonapterin reductase [unclassified Vibrio]PMI19102.1 dihydromonapterin reductase [Vibrio sp. 10N.286.46.E10]PMI97558.1 dihydromonapterin reductase [Vibrio sp. 10N.286.45.E10]PTO96386.1 dihydromonapterin reductase [Vibrio sp. 10N.286.45.A3]PTP13081.1 dihydromonapterin reductase [Vibrio sp. 10N.286.51.C3]PTQ21479.1 dihydromonapterin reductase [Vibrio sp. 10N.286.46.E10]